MTDLTSWSVKTHDTVPAVDLWLSPLETHTYLFAFLNAGGDVFQRPYSGVRTQVQATLDERAARARPRQAPRADIADERIRTWKAVFERFGFIRIVEDSNVLELTPLGRRTKQLYDTLQTRIEGANDHLARMAISVLNRYTLRNPLDGSDYPEDSDLHPFRLIWRAMRQLDDSIHWEEVNRVLMHILYEREVDEAIAKIRKVRKKVGGKYTEENVVDLGDPAVEEEGETKRRITPWLTRAGFGGLLITPSDDEDGYRHLVGKYKPLIDSALDDSVPTPDTALASREEYVRYLCEDEVVQADPEDETDKQELARVKAAVEKYGGSKMICFSGLPGTGKTRLAKMAATTLVENDPYRFMEIQFREGTSYEQFVEGFVPRPSGEGFELRPKTLRVINRRASLDPDGKPYVLLIEEFTRANIHAVLGELLTYVEHRERPFRWSISQEEGSVAPNLVIMATFNPRDKSALALDHAVLRRLHQIPLQPSADRLREILDGKLDPALLDQLCEWYASFLDILPFGHGEFASARSAIDLRSLWRGTLVYFLQDPTGAVRDIYESAAEAYPWA